MARVIAVSPRRLRTFTRTQCCLIVLSGSSRYPRWFLLGSGFDLKIRLQRLEAVLLSIFQSACAVAGTIISLRRAQSIRGASLQVQKIEVFTIFRPGMEMCIQRDSCCSFSSGLTDISCLASRGGARVIGMSARFGLA